MTIFKVNILAKLKSIFWPSWGSRKKGQLGQNIDFENLRAFFFVLKIVLKPLFLQCFFTLIVFGKTNLAKILTLETPKLGHNIDSTAYICISLYLSLSISFFVISLSLSPSLSLPPSLLSSQICMSSFLPSLLRDADN